MKDDYSIFYIDDDADDLEIFEKAVSSLHKPVRLFSMPEDLFLAMENPPPYPAIIFLDINMPLKSGFEIISEIRSDMKYDHTPLVVLSTAKDPHSIETAWKRGADMYLPKAVSEREFTNLINHIMSITWRRDMRNRESFVVS